MTHFDDMVATFEPRYGKARARFLAARLSRAIRRTGDTCISHVRVARLDRPEEVARYAQIRSGGCCAFEDVDLEFRPVWAPAEVERYRVGFCYGH